MLEDFLGGHERAASSANQVDCLVFAIEQTKHRSDFAEIQGSLDLALYSEKLEQFFIVLS